MAETSTTTSQRLTAQDQIAQYAAVAWQPEDLIELRCIPTDRESGAPVSFWTTASVLLTQFERLKSLNVQGMNIFAGILPRVNEGGRTDADCAGGYVVWADFDGVTPEEALRIVEAAGLPRPSMVVNSGHGAHLYWALDNLWTTGVGVEPAKISALVGDMAALLGSDPAVKNPSRILRLPGFTNWKNPVADCTLLYADLALRYPFDQLRAIVPGARPSCTDTPQAGGGRPEESGADIVRRATLYAASVPGANEGGRNAAAYRLAANLRRDFSLNDTLAWSLLEDWNRKNLPPLRENELHAVFESAGRHAKHAPGAKADARLTKGEADEALRERIAQWKAEKVHSLQPDAPDAPSIPPPQSIRELVTTFPALRPPVIHGLLRQGETMNVISSPKMGKSWLVTDMALCVAVGRPWLGFETDPGAVLVVDNELHGETISNRIPKVATARGIPFEDIADKVFVVNLRGRLRDIFAMGEYFRTLTPGKFKVIVLDAFYRFQPRGSDENDNGTMANIYNAIDGYADSLRSCFVLIHHSTKGIQSGKAVTDVGAGAGAQSRAADSHLILRAA